jgi:quercetin dioxygenase-like cupin family protein
VRKIVTGVDDAGRSCVVEESDMAFGPADAARPGRTRVGIFETTEAPPPPRPPGHGEFIDLGVANGCIRWQVLRFEPGSEIKMHHTDTLDFDMILEGSLEMVLDDGAHLLGAGDCVVMTGVDHEWRAGPDGFVMSVMTFGTPPGP